MKVDICIATKDRWTEVALTLESLRKQTYQDFDVYILDDKSGTPLIQSYFIQALANRMRFEGHRVRFLRNEIPRGVCGARNILIDDTNKNGNGELVLRLDDDVVLQSDYIKKLVEGIEKGYDMMSGVIPMLTQPETKREVKFVKPLMNEHKLDGEGNIIDFKDECAYCYIEDEIVPTHQFRTNALYKKEIQEKIKYPIHLSHTGFREEGFFSFKTILEGYKIGIHTGAVAYHLQCPSGGVRSLDYVKRVDSDDKLFREWVKERFKEKGDFLKEYKDKFIKNE